MNALKYSIFFIFLILFCAVSNNGRAQENKDIILYYHSEFPEESLTIDGNIDSISCKIFNIDTSVDKIDLDRIVSYKFHLGEAVLEEAISSKTDNVCIINSYLSKDGKQVTAVSSCVEDGGWVNQYAVDQQENNWLWIVNYGDMDRLNDTVCTEYKQNSISRQVKSSSFDYMMNENIYFDKRGNIIQKLYSYKNYNKLHLIEYNKNNLKEKEIIRETTKNGIEETITTYSYKTDEKGNWIERVEFGDNAKIKTLTKREIFYK